MISFALAWAYLVVAAAFFGLLLKDNDRNDESEKGRHALGSIIVAMAWPVMLPAIVLVAIVTRVIERKQ